MDYKGTRFEYLLPILTRLNSRLCKEAVNIIVIIWNYKKTF